VDIRKLQAREGRVLIVHDRRDGICTERSERDPPSSRSLHRADDLAIGAVIRTACDQEANLSVLESSERIGERAVALRIDPLDIIDREEYIGRPSDGMQAGQNPSRDSARICRLARVSFEKRDRQRVPLGLGQPIPDRGIWLEEVSKNREREVDIRIRWGRSENGAARFASRGHSGLPKRRLPDPWFAI
jgi:hypothetical protein